MIELITGHGQTPHVESDDIGNFNASMLGKGSYIMDGCSVSVADANTVNISTGGLLLEGRYVRITGSPESLKIENGAMGFKRYDVLYAKYTRTPSDLIENVKFGIETGVPDSSAPTIPNIARGSILAGDAEVVIPVAIILIDGLTPTVSSVVLNELKRPKRLWHGEWDSGSINVPGTDNYNVFLLVKAEWVMIAVRRPPAPSINPDVHIGDIMGIGVQGYPDTSTIYVFSFNCRTNGDVWSGKYLRGIRISPNHNISASERVTSIWGLM